MVTLGAPRQISPLIRFGRWAALLTGIAYGYKRYNYLANREIEIQKYENEIRSKHAAKKAAEKEVLSKKIQKYENEIRSKHAAKKAAEKEVLSKMEMDSLGKEAGVMPN